MRRRAMELEFPEDPSGFGRRKRLVDRVRLMRAQVVEHEAHRRHRPLGR